MITHLISIYSSFFFDYNKSISFKIFLPLVNSFLLIICLIKLMQIFTQVRNIETPIIEIV